MKKKLNRVANKLHALEFIISSPDGSFRYDYNGLKQISNLVEYEKFGEGYEIESIISGQLPTFLVRFDDIEAYLTLDEIDRLARKDLKLKEVEFLKEYFGEFYLISNLFYDADNKANTGPVIQGENVEEYFRQLFVKFEKKHLDKNIRYLDVLTKSISL